MTGARPRGRCRGRGSDPRLGRCSPTLSLWQGGPGREIPPRMQLEVVGRSGTGAQGHKGSQELVIEGQGVPAEEYLLDD